MYIHFTYLRTILIILVDIYKAQYPLIAKALYNNMVKTIKKYTIKTIFRYNKID